MMRVFFVFDDPLDETGVNLSYVDVPTEDPAKALERVERAAHSGELWEHLYPDEQEHPFNLIPGKMMYQEIPVHVDEETVLSL